MIFKVSNDSRIDSFTSTVKVFSFLLLVFFVLSIVAISRQVTYFRPNGSITKNKSGIEEIKEVSHQSTVPQLIDAIPLFIIVITRSILFSLKYTGNHLAAGLCPDPLGELERSPRPSSRIRELGPQEGRGREGGMEREGKGKEGREESAYVIDYMLCYIGAQIRKSLMRSWQTATIT